MAALVYAFPEKRTLEDALASVPKPRGVKLDSIEFAENSHGEPSIFVTYAVATRGESDETQAKALSALVHHSLRAMAALNLPFFEYVDFRSEPA